MIFAKRKLHYALLRLISPKASGAFPYPDAVQS